MSFQFLVFEKLDSDPGFQILPIPSHAALFGGPNNNQSVHTKPEEDLQWNVEAEATEDTPWAETKTWNPSPKHAVYGQFLQTTCIYAEA